MNRKYVCIAALLTSLLSIDAFANVTIEGVGFNPVEEIHGRSLALKGTGVIKYLGIFKVSVAGFYLPREISADRALSDIPRRLELEYLHAIKKEDFAESTRTWIQKNTSDETFERLKPQIERFNAFYEDVVPGDRYTLTYTPGLGTSIALNGDVRGTLRGAEFSAALFSIWIGDKPLSDKLRDGLLGS